MAKLDIRIGASVDRSLTVAFQPLIESAKKAQKAIESESKRAARAISTETKKGVDDAEAKFKELEKQITTGMPKATHAGTAAVKDFAKETSSHFNAVRRNFNDVARDAEAAMRRMAKADRMPGTYKRTARAASGKETETFGVRPSASKALGLTKSAAGAISNIAMDVARGAGVSDFSSLMQKNVSLEDAAVQMSNSGYMAGKKGPAGIRQDPKKLMEEMRNAAIATGNESGDIAGGMQAFTGKTGDLQTGRDLMERLGKLSKATGASTEDMFDAAGDVSNALGDVDHKAEKVYAVMKAIAAQGKEGAVEIKDLATQMAKLGAASGAFRGDHASVMADMGALAQMSRAKGGSASATQAATSVQSFVNTFDKGAREKAFRAFGVKTRDDSGRLMESKQIIIDSIKAASSAQHGGMGQFSENMGQMFMDARARSATRGFETVYKDAGGGEAGIKAVADAFDQLKNSVMDEKEVTDSFNVAMSTQSSKAKQFNENWSKAIAEVQSNMLPALQSMAPAINDATKAIASAIGFVSGGTKKTADDKGRATDIEAFNTEHDLAKKFKDGTLTEDDLKKGTDVSARLGNSIKEKKANMASKPGVADKMFGNDFFQARMTAYEQDQKQLASMETSKSALDDRTRMDDTMKAVLEELKAQRAQRAKPQPVEIVTDRTKSGVPTIPQNGRTEE